MDRARSGIQRGYGKIFAVPVYLIAAFSYAMVHSENRPIRSSDILFNCPRCGQHLAVEQRGAEIAVNCPGCNEQIEIPRRIAPLTATTQPPPIAP